MDVILLYIFSPTRSRNFTRAVSMVTARTWLNPPPSNMHTYNLVADRVVMAPTPVDTSCTEHARIFVPSFLQHLGMDERTLMGYDRRLIGPV